MKTSDEEKLQAIIDAISEQEITCACEHPRRVHRDSYSEGSYYDREECTTNEHCAYCGYDFGEIKHTTGGYG